MSAELGSVPLGGFETYGEIALDARQFSGWSELAPADAGCAVIDQCGVSGTFSDPAFLLATLNVLVFLVGVTNVRAASSNLFTSVRDFYSGLLNTNLNIVWHSVSVFAVVEPSNWARGL
jgi:hypothetical protein